MDNKSIFQGLLIFVAVAVLAYLIYDYWKRNQVNQEDFEDFEELDTVVNDTEPMEVKPEPVVTKTDSRPRPVESTDKQKQKQKQDFPTNCFPKDKLSAEDLLPNDAANSEWAQVNPAGQGDVQNQNFLSAGYHVGINSVGSTLRNANLQIRSEPPNPQVKVSPWLQSTIEPDLNRQPLEISGCD
jgi:hypothetical protein